MYITGYICSTEFQTVQTVIVVLITIMYICIRTKKLRVLQVVVKVEGVKQD